MKEDDGLIQLLLSRASTLGARRAFAELQDLLAEHCAEPAGSRLSALCPGVGRVFRELDLVRAFDEYDGAFFISARRFVPLSFLESRQVFNLASVAAAAEDLKLVTLDADDTIYSDGGSLDPSSPMIPLITRLLVRGVHVALVTAASYPGQPERFEARLAGLLSALSCAIECGAPPEPLLTRFRVMTGQCNVLLVPDLAVVGSTPKVTLREVAGEEWKAHRGVRWAPDDIKKLLDTAQHTFEEVSRSLQLQVSIVRKERAVGLIAASGSPLAAGRLTHDVLEELTLAVQEELGKSGTTVPFCAFNGGESVHIRVRARHALEDRSAGGVAAALQPAVGVERLAAVRRRAHVGEHRDVAGSSGVGGVVAAVADPHTRQHARRDVRVDVLGEVADGRGRGGGGGGDAREKGRSAERGKSLLHCVVQSAPHNPKRSFVRSCK